MLNGLAELFHRKTADAPVLHLGLVYHNEGRGRRLVQDAHVVWILSERSNQRFGTLVGGISTRMLTARLRLLEEYCVVSRHVVQTTPPR